MVYITGVHMSGGSSHRHIAEVRWENPGFGQVAHTSRAEMVAWIERRGGDARVRRDTGEDVRVGVVHADPPYLCTHARGAWTDDLFALPRY